MIKPENNLEESILKSVKDASFTPIFINNLMDSEIYFDIVGGHSNKEPFIIQKGSTVTLQPIQFEGITWLPIFSSLKQLQEWKPTDGTNYGHLNAKDFFEMVHSANVILNPNSEISFKFTHKMIQDFLDGSFYKPQQIRIEKQTTIFIRDPGNKYINLTTALINLFKRNKHEISAYLAEYYNPETKEPPHPLIGIETDGDYNQILAEAGLVATRISENKYIIDFINIKPNDKNFSKIKPFFKKNKSGWFFSK